MKVLVQHWRGHASGLPAYPRVSAPGCGADGTGRQQQDSAPTAAAAAPVPGDGVCRARFGRRRRLFVDGQTDADFGHVAVAPDAVHFCYSSSSSRHRRPTPRPESPCTAERGFSDGPTGARRSVVTIKRSVTCRTTATVVRRSHGTVRAVTPGNRTRKRTHTRGWRAGGKHARTGRARWRPNGVRNVTTSLTPNSERCRRRRRVGRARKKKSPASHSRRRRRRPPPSRPSPPPHPSPLRQAATSARRVSMRSHRVCVVCAPDSRVFFGRNLPAMRSYSDRF